MDLTIPSVSTSAPGARTGKARGESRGDAGFSSALSAASGEDTHATAGASAHRSKGADATTASDAKDDETSERREHRPADDRKRPTAPPVPGTIRLAGPIDKSAGLSPRGRPGTAKTGAQDDASQADQKIAGTNRVDPFPGIAPVLDVTIAAPAASTARVAGAKAAPPRARVGAERPDLAKLRDPKDGKSAPPKLTDKNSVAASRYQLQRLQPANHAVAAAAADPAHAKAVLKAAATSAGQPSSSPDIAAITAAATHNAVGTPGGAPFVGSATAPAAAVNASAATPAATYAMHVPVASAAWQQELGQQLVHLVQRGTDSIDLHLNPRELGPLQIRLQLHDQTAQVHFLVANADVQNAVQQAIPQLREALADQGIALGQALVGQQQQQSSGSFGGGTDSPAWAARDAESNAVDPVGAVRVVATVPAGSGVDLYA